jgi:hypothetical protein
MPYCSKIGRAEAGDLLRSQRPTEAIVRFAPPEDGCEAAALLLRGDRMPWLVRREGARHASALVIGPRAAAPAFLPMGERGWRANAPSH